MNNLGFYSGLIAGIGLSNALTGHFLWTLSWGQSFLTGVFAMVIASVLVLTYELFGT